MVEIKSIQTEKIVYEKELKLPEPKKDKWFVYIIQCKNNSLYTGVTNDLEKRMKTHKSGRGSKYVKAKGFGKLLRFKECESKSSAQKAECKIKKLHKEEKLSWFNKSVKNIDIK